MTLTCYEAQFRRDVPHLEKEDSVGSKKAPEEGMTLRYDATSGSTKRKLQIMQSSKPAVTTLKSRRATRRHSQVDHAQPCRIAKPPVAHPAVDAHIAAAPRRNLGYAQGSVGELRTSELYDREKTSPRRNSTSPATAFRSEISIILPIDFWQA
ncbi:uncharacterized protein ColSpa_00584 [Colletotrichum spaethianum]|uniref:Uncharacterized protein n=1 Tax=Colletotrichum spaethianum TaxID=700344 RepID=A0AA37NXT5_9PEZI|nr:uncharacterized protein ColSpa_00584 [Colletotrichum spaethianum]GKT40403.1 hypothetical protein ColSpa_00584 [Colletotrichum spaethianum]